MIEPILRGFKIMAAQETYINIDKVAELKGLKSNRSLRVEINKENSKYKARKIKTQGGYTYEILFSTLESEIQEKLIDEEIKSHSLIPVNNHSEFRTQLKYLLGSREIFFQFMNGTFITDIQKAAQFYFIVTRSFAGKCEAIGLRLFLLELLFFTYHFILIRFNRLNQF